MYTTETPHSAQGMTLVSAGRGRGTHQSGIGEGGAGGTT